MLKANVKKLYKEQYPNLTIKEIEEEIALFELTLFDKAGIRVDSSNRQKYLRGWLMRANLMKEEMQKNKEPNPHEEFFIRYNEDVKKYN